MKIATGKHIPKSSALLACSICEGASTVISQDMLRNMGKRAEKLQELEGFSAGVKEKNPTITDENGDDIPLSFRGGKWGYLDQDVGWVNVNAEMVGKYRLNLDWLPYVIRRDLEMSQVHPPQELVSECFWRLGEATLSTKMKAEIFFARRLNHSKTFEQVYQALNNIKGIKKAIILTTSNNFPLGCSLPGHHQVIQLEDCLEHTNNNFRIDRNILKEAMGGAVTQDGFSEDFRKASFNNIEYNFSTLQSSIVQFLHENGKTHKHSLMASVNSAQDDPKGVFRKSGEYHPAWGNLIKNDTKGYYWLEY